jgi:hypothetical protein
MKFYCCLSVATKGITKRKGSNNMAFKIVGTTGCRHTEDQGWMAYMPIKLKSDEFYLTLAENDTAIPGNWHFYLRGKEGWENFARCDFPEDHKYMYVYRELLRALETAMATGTACEPEKLDVPLTPTDFGIVPVSESQFTK